MITFEVIDKIPTGSKPANTRPKKVLVGAGVYYGGYMRCGCGAESPMTDDPLAPFRWLARHVCH